jgi:hypothetical protein
MKTTTPPANNPALTFSLEELSNVVGGHKACPVMLALKGCKVDGDKKK